MINKFFLILEKVIVSAILIYTYDSLIFFSNHMIPINFINISLVSFFGIIGLFYLILFSFFI